MPDYAGLSGLQNKSRAYCFGNWSGSFQKQFIVLIATFVPTKHETSVKKWEGEKERARAIFV